MVGGGGMAATAGNMLVGQNTQSAELQFRSHNEMCKCVGTVGESCEVGAATALFTRCHLTGCFILTPPSRTCLEGLRWLPALHASLE